MDRLCSAEALAAIALVAVATATPAFAQDDGHAAPALRGPMLSWPGKVAPRIMASADSAAPPRREPRAMAPVRALPSRYAPTGDAPGAWRRVPSDPAAQGRAASPVASQASLPAGRPVLAGAPGAARALPSSIYGADRPTAAAYAAQASSPSPAAQPVRTAALGPPVRRPWPGQGVRFYSVHRQYGLTPDPAPIPPQFFATTADLSDPAGPQPARLASGAASTAQALRARAASEANAGADAASGQP